MTTERDVRETPPELFEALDAEFRFTLDACADHTNAKCERYCLAPDDPFWTSDDWDLKPRHDVKEIFRDGLKSCWEGERVWCNPPFSDIEPWVKKAWESKAECVVMLVPANRTEQSWWQDYVETLRGQSVSFVGWRAFDVRFLRGRTRFLKNGVRMGSPNFACCLLIWSL